MLLIHGASTKESDCTSATLVSENTARANRLDKAVKTHSRKEKEGFRSCTIISDEGKEGVSKG